jgi:hypothetical protein
MPESIAASTGSAYFGALVNPAGNTTTAVQQTHSFETSIGRKLALDMHYENWTPTSSVSLAKVASDPLVQDDISNGRTPVLSWRCGASMTDIASGAYDQSVVIPAAKAVAGLNHRVILRWFWEFNLDLNGEGTNSDSPACFSSTSTVSKQTQFINAWEHIRSVFIANGATNVTWLWCPARSAATMSSLPTYLPPHVDWIGIDAYDSSDVGFAQSVQVFYRTFSGYSQPLMIAELGEESAASPYTQANFLNDAEKMIPASFPKIRALLYYDAPGHSPNNWALNAGGKTALKQLANDPYFAAVP